jgi:hypothetical protein
MTELNWQTYHFTLYVVKEPLFQVTRPLPASGSRLYQAIPPNPLLLRRHGEPALLKQVVTSFTSVRALSPGGVGATLTAASLIGAVVSAKK